MVAYPVTSMGSCILLLLAASLNAHNQEWDDPVCTEPEVSAPRGSRVLMACNISHTFTDVTIELTANGKTVTIFDQKPPGNYFSDSWHLQIQGGRAQLVITDAQDIHAGKYLWRLHGLQRQDENLTLNVTDLDTANQEPETLHVNAEPPPSVNKGVIVVIIILSSILIGVMTAVSVFVCCKRSRSPKYHRYEVPGPDLSHEFPGGPHWTLPKVLPILQQKVLKGPYPDSRLQEPQLATQGALLVPDSRLQEPQLARADNLYLDTPHVLIGQAHGNLPSPGSHLDPGTP